MKDEIRSFRVDETKLKEIISQKKKGAKKAHYIFGGSSLGILLIWGFNVLFFVVFSFYLLFWQTYNNSLKIYDQNKDFLRFDIYKEFFIYIRYTLEAENNLGATPIPLNRLSKVDETAEGLLVAFNHPNKFFNLFYKSRVSIPNYIENLPELKNILAGYTSRVTQSYSKDSTIFLIAPTLLFLYIIGITTDIRIALFFFFPAEIYLLIIYWIRKNTGYRNPHEKIIALLLMGIVLLTTSIKTTIFFAGN